MKANARQSAKSPGVAWKDADSEDLSFSGLPGLFEAAGRTRVRRSAGQAGRFRNLAVRYSACWFICAGFKARESLRKLFLNVVGDQDVATD